jgi:hypothetical protein
MDITFPPQLDLQADTILGFVETDLRNPENSEELRQVLKYVKASLEQYIELQKEAVEYDKFKPIHLRRIALTEDLEQKVKSAEPFCRMEFVEDLLRGWLYFQCDPNDELQFRRFMRYSKKEAWFPENPELVQELNRLYERQPDEPPTPREQMVERGRNKFLNCLRAESCRHMD